MVFHVVTETWYPQSIVAPMSRMNFNVSIALQKHHFTVIVAEHLTSHHFRIKASFEFQRQIVHFEAFHSRLVRSGGYDELIVGGHANCAAGIRHVKLLNEFDSLAKIRIFVEKFSSLLVAQPLEGNDQNQFFER